MAGIADISNRFRELAPSANLKRVSMSYDNDTEEQVFKFYVGETIIERRAPFLLQGPELIELVASQAAEEAAAPSQPMGLMSMPNIGPQGLMMAPDTPEQRRIDEAFAGENRIFGAAEVPQTPFSSQASDTKTDEGTSQ